MIRRHFRHQLLLGYVAAINQIGEQRIDKRFLVRVGMPLVATAPEAAKKIERAALP